MNGPYVVILKNVYALYGYPLYLGTTVEAVRCCVLKETEFFAPIHLDNVAEYPRHPGTQASSFLAT